MHILCALSLHKIRIATPEDFKNVKEFRSSSNLFICDRCNQFMKYHIHPLKWKFQQWVFKSRRQGLW
jgi:hypothetical protein